MRKVTGDFDVASIRPGVKDLLTNAASKVSDLPLIVFVELNLPPENTERPTWIPQARQVIAAIKAAHGGRSPFAAVIFTNRPHVHGAPGQSDPGKHVYAIWPADNGLPDEFVVALGNAAHQYGNVPSFFPDDFRRPPEIEDHGERQKADG
jgi:hypothetical protein